MEKPETVVTDPRLNLVLQELKENPFQKFNVAFSLMSVIPFLVFFYLLVSKFFTVNILIGNVGLILFISVFLSLCGFCIGYNIINNILRKIMFYAAQAKRSDQLKSTFVATVSHELKSPLSVIKAGLDNIRDGLVGQINEEQRRIIDLCHSIIARLNSLINELLDLHKIEAGLTEAKRKLCDLLRILEEQLKEFEVLLNKKRIKLIKDFLAKDFSLWADEEKIMLVINNLLSNAIKYTPEEGMITLKIFSVDGCVRIEFQDTGPGIPEDKLGKIFDKFERLDIAKEGTGLGLAITKDIVELHKGKIWAESQPGKGSKFIIVLPCDLRHTKR